MLIKDEAVQAKHAELDPKYRQHFENNLRLREHMAQCDWYDEVRPDLEEKQRGKAKTQAEIEAMIKNLVPGELRFMVNPTNPSKKAVYKVQPDGGCHLICCFENSPLTREWSILKPIYEWVPDPNVEVITPDMVAEQGDWAGFKLVVVNVIEMVRGWRTILINLANSGYTSRELVDRLYPVDKADRVNWAAKIKGLSVTPIY